MKRFLPVLILFCSFSIAQSQTIFNPNDAVITYDPTAPAGSQTNPNQAFGYNIIKWVRTVRMSYNTDRYKCYMIGNIPFRLRYPDSYNPAANDGKKYPIMLFFHGGGEATANTRDNEFHLLNGGSTFPEKIQYGTQDAFILFPQSRNVGWDNSYYVPMNIVIDSLIKNCKGDEDRVYSMGLSIGGFAAMDYSIQYPKRAAVIIPNSPVFLSGYAPSFSSTIQIPLWMGTGGQDTNPDPNSAEGFVNGYRALGGDLYWSYYPRQGHVMWDYQWAEEPTYSNRMALSHKANPMVYFGNRFFCPGSPVSSRMAITPGFYQYQWSKNDITISGATSNEYIATDFGTYKARFKRTATSDWSAWSLDPAVVVPVCPPTVGTGTGLNGNYYNNTTFTAPVSLNRLDPAMNFAFENGTRPGTGVSTNNYSVRWTGKIQPQFTETYTIYTKSDDGIRLWINGVLLIDNYVDHGITEDQANFSFIAGQKYDIKIEYYNRNGAGTMFLKWSSPNTVKQMVPTKQLYPEGTGDPGPPVCTTNISPANNATLPTATTATISWNAQPLAGSYDVYLWSGATPPATPNANVSTTSYNASGLTPGNTYKWYIAPRNGTGVATGCAAANTSTFTINPFPPACVTNLTPANGSTTASGTVANFTWEAAPTATSYDIYLWTGATPPATPTATVATPAYNVNNLLPSTVYFWYVVPKNVSGPATDCNLYNKTGFTTAAGTPTVPICVSNTSPANGTTIATQTTAALTWNASANATSYDVYIWTGATPPATPTVNVGTNSYNAGGLMPSTLYNWYVAPRNAAGVATGCDVSGKTTFSTAAVVIPVPGCATNTLPANGSTIATQTTASLTWSTVANATSYDVYLWIGPTPPATPTANVAVTSYNATSLIAGTLYNWYVVPKNATGAATGCDLSNKTTFTTAAIPVPACVTNTSPANAAVLATQTTATLTWPSAATATSYDVYLWTGATPPATPTANVATLSYNATALTAGALYNWYIAPRNASGPATGCDVSNKTTFTTAAIPVPACVTNTSPANGAVLATQTTATLTWPSAATATSYDVYLWTGATPPATPTANVATLSYNATALTPGTLYNWYISPRNASGPATGCDVSNKTTFTTAAVVIPVPGCATNTLPANASTIATQTTASLTWGTVANATSYEVYLWTGATAPTTPVATVTATNYDASGLTAGTLYNWYIIPKNATGSATGCALSNTSTFTTAPVPVPLCVSNTAPVNAAQLATQTSATLTWTAAATATSYDVYLWSGAVAPSTPVANITATTYPAAGLTAGTLYNWYIVPRNAGGAAVGCNANASTFTTAFPVPACVTNTSPANGAVLATQTTATLTWPAAATATSYDVYLWTGATPPGTPTANVATTSYNATSLIANTLYNWYIVPRNASGPATGCDISNKTSFTTASVAVPACAVNVSPATGTIIGTETSAALLWNAVPTATSYDVYVWTGATPPATPVMNVSVPSANVSGLVAATLYNWYVIPRNASGPATGCDLTSTSTFTTATAAVPVPGCAVNNTPANGTTLVTQTTAGLTWGSVPGAASYDVYLWTGATPPATPTSNVSVTSYNVVSLTANTLYNWYIVPRNAGGPATGCDLSSKSTFTTAAIPVPLCVTNTSPANAAVLGTQTTATLTWPSSANATSYDVYLWTGAIAPTTPVANTTSTNYPAIGLTAGTLYNWYIVPKNTSGAATGCDLSNATTFTTAAVPVPLCVTNTSPASAAVLATQTTATLTWTTAANATSYDVYIWSGAVAPSTPVANVTLTTYQPSGLTPGTVYNWYIAPRNAGGAATGCSANASTFTTAVPVPVCVTNTSPANGATIATQTTATLTWPAAANATSYDVYLWTGATPPATPTANVSVTSYNATALTASTLYNWYIVPRNVSGAATGCEISNKTTFTTAAVVIPVPGCATNTLPANGSTIATQTTASLTWSTVANATSYDVYLWTGGTPPATPTVNVAITSYNATSLIAGALYNWYIVPKNATGAATGCDLSNKTTFTTASIPVPLCVTNASPANGAVLATQTTATLTWPSAATATSYDVYLWTGATPPATPTANVATLSYNATALTAGTLYNWYIAPRNASGPATGCDVSNKTTFTTAAVVVPVPGCATNTLPANGSTIATQTTAGLTWSTVANATSYDVYLWTGATPPATPTANVGVTSYNATSLIAGTLYNWYVVPKNATGAATGCDLSNKTTFTTAAIPVPSCVTNTSPANAAVLATQTTATLTWPSAATATSYDVYLWTGATPPATPTANVATLSYNATALTAGTLYNWYIAPRNASGPATGCSVSNKTTFTTASGGVTPGLGTGLQGVYYNGTAFAGAPLLTRIDTAINFDLTYSSIPQRLSPAPGIVPEDNFSVRWTGQVKPLYSETYTFYTVSDDGIRLYVNGVLLVNNFVNQGATEKSGTIALVAGQKYDVVIEYYEATGEAVTKLSWSSASTPKAIVPKSQLYPPGFVDPTVPNCTGNTSPAGGSTIASATTVALTWNAAPDATSYDVYIWTGATPPASPTANVTTTTYNAAGLTASTLYNWYVTPKNAVGSATGCSSNSTSFTTGAPAPVCTNNLLPANNAVLGTANTATLSWTAAASATSYDVYIWTGATPPATPTANVAGTSYNANGLTAGSLYNWYVSPVNAGGAATGCSTTKTTFTTGAAPAPSCTINTSPANNSVIVTPNTAALSWNVAQNATSYDVYVYTGATPPATPTANTTLASYTATGLTPATAYNWFVIPKNAAGSATGCGTSNRTSFTTGAPAAGTGLQGVYYNGTAFAGTPLLTRIDPTINFDLTYSSIPQRLSPAPGIVPEDNFSVRWSGQVKALYSETYTFYTVSDDGIRLYVNGVLLVNNFVNQGATEKSGTIALVAGQKYDILIEYYEATGEATTKLLWSSASTPKAIVPQSQLYPPGFVDPTVPGCTSNTSPANGSTILTAATAALAWNAAPDATSYDVYVWTGATPPATPTANVATTSYNAGGLTANTLYNWYVIPKNAVGSANGCSGNSTSFTTGAPAPACTNNLLPANNAVLGTANTASLSWTAAATATSYDVYIWTGATPPATPTANVATTSYNATGLTAGSTYNWYVAPKNAGGTATGCSSNKTAFVTAAAPVPGCTVNTSPANGSTVLTSTTATLTWNTAINATSYDVFIYTGAIPPATATANVSTTSYNAAGLTVGTLYNWFVAPKNAAGSATGCGTSAKTTFTTASEADGTGLQGVYYNGTAFAGTPLLTRVDPTINFDLTYSSIPQRLSPAPGIVPEDNFSVRWTGQVKALYSETYTFYTVSDDGIRLYVNGVLLVNNFVNQGATEKSGTITLVAGQKYDILIEYYEAAGEAVAKLLWSSASTPKAIVPQSQLYPPGTGGAGLRVADPAVTTTAVTTTASLLSAAQPTLSSTVSPNPVRPGQTARLQINSDKTGTANVSIINSSGFVISTQKVNLLAGMNTVTINTSPLGLGFYIINITGGTAPVNLKLMVE